MKLDKKDFGNKKVKLEAKNIKELDDKLKTFSKNNEGVITASVVFGTVFVKTFRFLSQVGLAQITDSPVGRKGFWKNGKFQPFTKEFISKKSKSNRNKNFSVFSGG